MTLSTSLVTLKIFVNKIWNSKFANTLIFRVSKNGTCVCNETVTATLMLSPPSSLQHLAQQYFRRSQ